jgi:hypothetical protein
MPAWVGIPISARHLAPERAVVVEHRDPFVVGNEIEAIIGGDAADEVDDGTLGRALVPGRQRIGGRSWHSWPRSEAVAATTPMMALGVVER